MIKIEQKDILFRASQNGKLLTEPQKIEDRKNGELSISCRNALIQIYCEQFEGRHTEIYSKYLEKGNTCEEDSIDLLSVVTKRIFQKAPESFEIKNDYFSGHIDTWIGDRLIDGKIERIESIWDIKTKWSRETFIKTKFEKIDKDYEVQLSTYGDILNVENLYLAHCLVNGTPELIDDEKYRLKRELRLTDESLSGEYMEGARQIERNHIFDLKLFMNRYPYYHLESNVDEWVYDIPANDRVYITHFKRNDIYINQLKAKIPLLRQWIFDNLVNAKNEIPEIV